MKNKIRFGDPDLIKRVKQEENEIGKQKTYEIDFTYEFNGTIKIEAISEAEARELFDEMTFDDLDIEANMDSECSINYVIDRGIIKPATSTIQTNQLNVF